MPLSKSSEAPVSTTSEGADRLAASRLSDPSSVGLLASARSWPLMSSSPPARTVKVSRIVAGPLSSRAVPLTSSMSVISPPPVTAKVAPASTTVVMAASSVLPGLRSTCSPSSRVLPTPRS